MFYKHEREISCEVCGNVFQCTGVEGNDCWCMKLDNKIIDDKIGDCVCRNCLINFPAAKTACGNCR